MTLLLSAWTVGLLLALLALGVYVSFRFFSFPDITADGSFTLGASVAAVPFWPFCLPPTRSKGRSGPAKT